MKAKGTARQGGCIDKARADAGLERYKKIRSCSIASILQIHM